MKMENNKTKTPKVIFSHALGWMFLQIRNTSNEMSKHDLSKLGRNMRTELGFCNFCYTPIHSLSTFIMSTMYRAQF